MKHSEVPRDVCCIIQSDKVTVCPALRGVWVSQWWGWGQMCVTAAVCFFFFWWCFSTDFYSNFSSVVKLSVAALIRVNDTDRKQSACCHSTVAPRQPTTSGQRDGRGPQGPRERKKERKKERKCSFLLSLLLSTAPSTEAPLLSVLIRQALRESTAAQ